jgi:hypothetical protein
LEINDIKILLNQTINHINQLKTDNLPAHHLCRHIHDGFVPEQLTRIHPEDEDIPILAIPFEVRWKPTWLSEDTVRSIPHGNIAIHNYIANKPPLRKEN